MAKMMQSYVTRDAIMKLLSDEEIAKVSAAEARRPIEGEDYVDLEHPENGILKIDGTMPARPGSILPRSAVHEKTWATILKLVAG